MSGRSSPASRTALAFYNRALSCWKMSQQSLASLTGAEGDSMSLPRLPNWGSTTSDGVLYEHQTPERLTAARDGSALPRLPTPTATNAKESGTQRDWGGDLTAALLPTPVVNDMGRGKTPEEWDSWTDEMKGRHGNGNGHGPSLAIEIARLPGIATRLPSNDGNGSSDDPHPPQPMIEDSDPSSSSG